MAATFVVDASVVVEFLAPGELGDEADRFVGGLAWSDPLALVAPDLLFLEVASALDRLARRRHLSAGAANRSLGHLLELPIASVAAPALLEEAWRHRGNTSIYDAAYLALASGLDVPLVTADRRLARAARGAGARAWVVDDPDLATLLDSLES